MLPQIYLSTKTMIFVTTTNDCELLANHLANNKNLPAWSYHARLGLEERRGNWEAWSAEKQFCVLVSTSLGGTGRNQPLVDLVIELTLRPHIYSLAQEFGRAGRQGQKSQCIIVAHPILVQPLGCFVDFENEFEHRHLLDMTKLVNTRECRRHQIQSLLGDELYYAHQCPTMDDEGSSGSCDICDPSHLAVGESTYRTVDVTYAAIELINEINASDVAFYTRIYRHGSWRSNLSRGLATSCFVYVLSHYLRLGKIVNENEDGIFDHIFLAVDGVRSAEVMQYREKIWVSCAFVLDKKRKADELPV